VKYPKTKLSASAPMAPSAGECAARRSASDRGRVDVGVVNGRLGSGAGATLGVSRALGGRLLKMNTAAPPMRTTATAANQGAHEG